MELRESAVIIITHAGQNSNVDYDSVDVVRGARTPLELQKAIQKAIFMNQRYFFANQRREIYELLELIEGSYDLERTRH